MFFEEGLGTYSVKRADTRQNLHKLPILMTGDFNVEFSKENSEFLTIFLREEFCLSSNTDFRIATTRYGTCLDAVFSRYIESVDCKLYSQYFSQHRPILTVINDSQQ